MCFTARPWDPPRHHPPYSSAFASGRRTKCRRSSCAFGEKARGKGSSSWRRSRPKAPRTAFMSRASICPTAAVCYGTTSSLPQVPAHGTMATTTSIWAAWAAFTTTRRRLFRSPCSTRARRRPIGRSMLLCTRFFPTAFVARAMQSLRRRAPSCTRTGAISPATTRMSIPGKSCSTISSAAISRG